MGETPRVDGRRDGPRRRRGGVAATYLSGSSPGGPRGPPLAIGTASSSVRETLGMASSSRFVLSYFARGRSATASLRAASVLVSRAGGTASTTGDAIGLRLPIF